MKKITNPQRALLNEMADWLSHQVDLDVDSPERAVDRFLTARDAGDHITEVYVLHDASDDSIGWWLYLPVADRWICFGFEDGKVREYPDEGTLLEKMSAPTAPSCIVGFDEGAAEIIRSFGIQS